MQEAERLAEVMMSRRQPTLMGMRLNCGQSSGSPVMGWLNDTSTEVMNSFLYVECVNDRMVQRVTNFEGIANMQISFLDVRFAAQVAEYKGELVSSNVSNVLKSLEMLEAAISRSE